MAEIIYDLEALHKPSEKIEKDEVDNVVEQLTSTIPANGRGMAAPQIGIHKRVFMARLSSGPYVFVNPEITWSSLNFVPSTESCLSIPNVTRCINRHEKVKMKSERAIFLGSESGEPIQVMETKEWSFTGIDSFIVQHENDHLDGKLILDYETIETRETKMIKRAQKRRARIEASRNKRKSSSPSIIHPKPKKISTKKAERLERENLKKKKIAKAARRRARKRVEIEERQRAHQEGLLNKEAPKIPESS